MLPQYEDWAANCSKLLGDLSVLRQWLKRHDAPLHILDIQDKLKRQILIAQTMLPPPDDFSSDDEDMMRDDEDTDALAELSETHVDFCYRSTLQSEPSTVSQRRSSSTCPRTTHYCERDVGTVDFSGLKKSLPRIEIERGKWILH